MSGCSTYLQMAQLLRPAYAGRAIHTSVFHVHYYLLFRLDCAEAVAVLSISAMLIFLES